jgi:hypothetical protein
MIDAYVDASMSKNVTGAGIKIIVTDGCAKIKFGFKVPIRPGMTATEAELYVLLMAIDLVLDIRESSANSEIAGITPESVNLAVFHTDNESGIKGIYGLSSMRSMSTSTLINNIVKKLDKAKKSGLSWSIAPVKTRNNQAHLLASEARRLWGRIWKDQMRT